MNKIKAIIFDLDGVLVDSGEFHFKALNSALKYYGYTPITETEHKRIYDGLPTEKKLNLYEVEKTIILDKKNDISTKKQEFTKNLLLKNIILNQEIYNLIKKLKEESYLLACCSNSTKETLLYVLKKLDISKFFDCILSNGDIKNPKPSPDIYLKAFQELNINANESLIIEDSEYGVNAATSAGGYLIRISHISEVNIENILNNIERIDTGGKEN